MAMPKSAEKPHTTTQDHSQNNFQQERSKTPTENIQTRSKTPTEPGFYGHPNNTDYNNHEDDEETSAPSKIRKIDSEGLNEIMSQLKLLQRDHNIPRWITKEAKLLRQEGPKKLSPVKLQNLTKSMTIMSKDQNFHDLASGDQLKYSNFNKNFELIKSDGLQCVSNLDEKSVSKGVLPQWVQLELRNANQPVQVREKFLTCWNKMPQKSGFKC